MLNINVKHMTKSFDLEVEENMLIGIPIVILLVSIAMVCPYDYRGGFLKKYASQSGFGLMV